MAPRGSPELNAISTFTNLVFQCFVPLFMLLKYNYFRYANYYQIFLISNYLHHQTRLTEYI
jgi:hypothetical protein